MTVTTQMKNKHLLWRAGFGIAASEISSLMNGGDRNLYHQLEKASAKEPVVFDVADNLIKTMLTNPTDMDPMMQARRKLSSEQRKQLRKQSAEDLRKLTLAWLNEMISSEAQLREKMALFWHGHFACIQVNIFYQQQLLQEIRKHALGNFGDLLKAVSKSASMLAFLNNQQNRKQHPNENFAREVMELFTLGRGNYTEEDVKEAARAFTGWGYNLNGDFVFRKNAHDEGSKTILGKAGNYDGDDVLNILLEQKQTAHFITQKIYRYFVNEDAPEERINQLAEKFYHSNYNIGKLMETIFTAKWFYDEQNIGIKIKSPVELMVGIRRMLPMQLQNAAIQILLQRALGQLLFYPPNVAGWPGGKSWIDSSTLMLRLRIPQLIKDDDTFYITPKVNDDQQMGMKENFDLAKAKRQSRSGFSIEAAIDWSTFIHPFTNTSRDVLFETLQQMLLQTFPGNPDKSVIENISSKTSREEYIKSVTIALMSTPEYQLC